MRLNVEQRREIDAIRDSHDGIVRPEDVIASARNPQSTLNGLFQWNVNEAARRYWLIQAREIIHAYVTVLPSDGEVIDVRSFISTPTIRRAIGSATGFVGIDDVTGNRALVLSLFTEAARQAKGMLMRFGAFPELRGCIQRFIDDLEMTRNRLEAQRLRRGRRQQPPEARPRL